MFFENDRWRLDFPKFSLVWNLKVDTRGGLKENKSQGGGEGSCDTRFLGRKEDIKNYRTKPFYKNTKNLVVFEEEEQSFARKLIWSRRNYNRPCPYSKARQDEAPSPPPHAPLLLLSFFSYSFFGTPFFLFPKRWETLKAQFCNGTSPWPRLRCTVTPPSCTKGNKNFR